MSECAETNGTMSAPHHLRARHGDRLGDDRVHFARHDARSWLHLGERDLPDARPRPAPHPPNIVGDLHETAGERIHRPAGCNGCVNGGLRLEVVRRLRESASAKKNLGENQSTLMSDTRLRQRQAGGGRQLIDHPAWKFRVLADAGAHRGTMEEK